jgi:hypothetical protein
MLSSPQTRDGVTLVDTPISSDRHELECREVPEGARSEGPQLRGVKLPQGWATSRGVFVKRRARTDGASP